MRKFFIALIYTFAAMLFTICLINTIVKIDHPNGVYIASIAVYGGGAFALVRLARRIRRSQSE